MKAIIILALALLAFSQNIVGDSSLCMDKSKEFFEQSKAALNQNSLDSIIDSV